MIKEKILPNLDILFRESFPPISLAITFMSADTDFWCSAPDGAVDGGMDAAAVAQWREQSSPLVARGGKEVRDQCNVWNATDFQRPPDNETRWGVKEW